ncbi:hypothetical protein ACVWZL_000019 [Bradyrhizobium sp. GM2.4]
MIAVNASTSPHSSATFHAVRQRRAHFGRRTKSCSPLGFRPAHFIASRRQTHHRHAAPPRQGAIGSPLKLNRDERRWGRPRERPGRGVLLDPFPKQVRVDPVFERKSQYRNARLKTTRDKTLLRCRLVAPATVPTNKPDPQFLIIVCHHKVSTYFGGHLMHQSTQKQKVQGNSRLRSCSACSSASSTKPACAVREARQPTILRA